MHDCAQSVADECEAVERRRLVRVGVRVGVGVRVRARVRTRVRVEGRRLTPSLPQLQEEVDRVA